MINYTKVMDNIHFGGGVFQVILRIVDTPRTETYFRLSDGSNSRTYTSGVHPELMIDVDRSVTFIRDSVIIITTPVPVDTFSFELGATIIGSNFVVTQRGSRGVVEVIESTGN